MTTKELRNYYFQLDETYSLSEKAHDFLLNQATWKYIPYIWVIENSPDKFETWIKNDRFLTALHNKFNGWVDFYLTKPRHAHGWHKDSLSVNEFVSINLVFEEYNSLTLFSVKSDKSQPDIHQFEELKYQPNKWTIMNTDQSHSVINREFRNRYLMCYRPRKGTKYQTVVDWYINEYKTGL
jgi:hypothetical protein